MSKYDLWVAVEHDGTIRHEDIGTSEEETWLWLSGATDKDREDLQEEGYRVRRCRIELEPDTDHPVHDLPADNPRLGESTL